MVFQQNLLGDRLNSNSYFLRFLKKQNKKKELLKQVVPFLLLSTNTIVAYTLRKMLDDVLQFGMLYPMEVVY